MLSFTEENYLKAIYHLSEGGNKSVLTNDLAEAMNTKAASVTDMVKRLSGKDLITYEKYYGVNITRQGKAKALAVVRKHRLWETFLVEKLHFQWDEVHDVAEQLEHIESPLLIEKLESFLGYPAVDPHGHPIPDKNGKINELPATTLADCDARKALRLRAVRDSSPSFLQYLTKTGVYIGARVTVLKKNDFDGSLQLQIDGKKKIFVSREAARNLLVNYE